VIAATVEPLATLTAWTGPAGGRLAVTLQAGVLPDTGPAGPPGNFPAVVRAWQRSRAAQWHPPPGVAILHTRN
jgi:hypothetical protein